ncbi:MAG: hypothetical protein M3Q58_14895 [Bacteroidota bacterium]|nr:hypothetical protein [Bacteroidota bacterium]
MRKYYSFIFLLFFITPLFSQNKVDVIDLKKTEAEMKDLGILILNSKSEEEKYKANERFISILEKTISEPASFAYPFDSLSTIARLMAPDNSFRIFNWHIQKEDGTFEYFGYIQPNPTLKNKKSNKDFYKLNDTKELASLENKSFSANEWPGAHYYKLIHVKDKKNKYYTLLGWDGNNAYSTKKIVDVLHFTSNGEPKFGAPIFRMEKKMQKRVIFEYAKDATMSLNYNEKDETIIFDHLSPNNQKLKGQYQFYGPDFSFDALLYKKGIWIFQPDINAKNIKSKKDKNWNKPE